MNITSIPLKVLPQSTKRPEILVVDNFIEKNIHIIPDNENFKVPHGIVVKASAEGFLKGRFNLKRLDYSKENDFCTNSKLFNAIKKINLTENPNLVAVNVSNSPSEYGFCSEESVSKKNIKIIIDKEFVEESYSNAKKAIDALKHIVALADKGLHFNFSAKNRKNQFSFFAYSRYLSEKPENINVVGALGLNGAKMKSCCNDKRFVNEWGTGAIYFEPVIYKHKILGFKLKGSDTISIRPSHFSGAQEIKISNKFSGLKYKQIQQKIQKLNQKGADKYKFEKIPDINGGHYEISCNGKNGVIFAADNKGIYLSSILYQAGSPTALIKGTSFSSPINLAKRQMNLLENSDTLS